MVPYFGDFAANATVYIPINTFDSNDPAASVTVTNLVNTDVHIHKDGGTTQRNNAAGITMTVDYDSITGNHLLIIDTSDNTVADFFQAGHEYQVRIEGATVDAGTVNAWVGSFSIERAGGALALAKAIYAAVITNAAGADVAADIIAVKGVVDDILTDTGTTIPGTISTMQGNVTDILTDTGTTLDTLIKDIPTVAEFEARTIVAADYLVTADLAGLSTHSAADVVTALGTGATLTSCATATGFTVVGDLAGLALTTDVTTAVSDLETYGDSNWATATGFSTTANFNTLDGKLDTGNAALTEILTRVPDATPCQSGGLVICGSNASTTFASFTITAALTTGSIVNNGVFTQTGEASIGNLIVTNMMAYRSA